MSSVMIASYLDDKESSALREKLESLGIGTIVKRHGLPSFFGVDSNYRVFVDRTDAEKAKDIAAEFHDECAKKRAEAVALLQTQCPLCASKEVEKKEKASLIEKIRFAGVTLWQCRKCGRLWYT